MFNGKIHYKWPFSIAMLVYQMVIYMMHWCLYVFVFNLYYSLYYTWYTYMMLIDAICICPIYVFNLYYTILYIYCHTERFYEDWEPSLHSHRLTVIWFSKTYQGCCLPNWRFKTKRWHPKFEPRYCAVGDWGQGPIIQRQAGTLLFHMVLGWFPTLFKSVLGSTNESALVAPLRSISIS